jgi:hypothetical protein
MLTQYSLIQINAYSLDVLEVFHFQDQDDNSLHDNVHATLSKGEANNGSSYDIDQEEMMIWCDNNKWYKLSDFMVEDGRCVPLEPNQWASAIADAERFVTKDFNDIERMRSRNQDLKDSNGANYFVGDKVFKVSRGGPIPDPSIFCGDPIKLIHNQRIPTAEMVRFYGTEVAEHKLNPMMQCNIPHDQTIRLSEYRQHLQWSYVTYHMMPRKGNNTKYKVLLRSWGWDV